MKAPTQTIKHHLQKHGSITKHEAKKLYGIDPLSTHISNLRSTKMNIIEQSEKIGRTTFNPNGETRKTTTRYILKTRSQVPAAELKELINLWAEQTKVDEMLGAPKYIIQLKKQIYNECSDNLAALLRGDKSIIEKLNTES